MTLEEWKRNYPGYITIKLEEKWHDCDIYIKVHSEFYEQAREAARTERTTVLYDNGPHYILVDKSGNVNGTLSSDIKREITEYLLASKDA